VTGYFVVVGSIAFIAVVIVVLDGIAYRRRRAQKK
jgi:hypothetical protein